VPVILEDLDRLHEGTRRLDDGDREGLEHQREPAVRFRSRHLHGRHAVFRALAARHPGGDDRRELHHVEMPPMPLRRVIVARERPPALRISHRRLLVVLHPVRRQLQIHPPHLPQRPDPLQHGVVRGHHRFGRLIFQRWFCDASTLRDYPRGSTRAPHLGSFLPTGLVSGAGGEDPSRRRSFPRHKLNPLRNPLKTGIIKKKPGFSF